MSKNASRGSTHKVAQLTLLTRSSSRSGPTPFAANTTPSSWKICPAHPPNPLPPPPPQKRPRPLRTKMARPQAEAPPTTRTRNPRWPRRPPMKTAIRPKISEEKTSPSEEGVAAEKSAPESAPVEKEDAPAEKESVPAEKEGMAKNGNKEETPKTNGNNSNEHNSNGSEATEAKEKQNGNDQNDQNNDQNDQKPKEEAKAQEQTQPNGELENGVKSSEKESTDLSSPSGKRSLDTSEAEAPSSKKLKSCEENETKSDETKQNETESTKTDAVENMEASEAPEKTPQNEAKPANPT